MKISLSDHFSYKRLFYFCLPPIIMMVFTSIYGVVDGLFVSNYVGKLPFTSINLIYPFIMIIGGFGFMAGSGGSALVAKTLGQEDSERANRYFSMVIKFVIYLSLILSVLGFIFIEPIAYLLGANELTFHDCVLYGRILLVFNVAFSLQNVFQTFLTTAEKPKLGLYITVAAGITNMILDALFVAVFNMGVVGAAIATGISQCVGGLLPLLYFSRENSSILRLTKASLEFGPLWNACTNGASELMSSISGSLISMLYNLQLLKYAGENGVAAYGVLMYIQFVFIAIFIGYAIGTVPIIGYHYGAKNRGELKSMLKKSMIIMVFTGIVMIILAQVLALPLARVFVGYDLELLNMTMDAFRIFSFSFLLAGVNIFSSSFFTALNNGAVSAAISFLRTLVFQMLSVLLLPLVFGLDGIWCANGIAEVFAFIISVGFLIIKRKKYHYF